MIGPTKHEIRSELLKLTQQLDEAEASIATFKQSMNTLKDANRLYMRDVLRLETEKDELHNRLKAERAKSRKFFNIAVNESTRHLKLIEDNLSKRYMETDTPNNSDADDDSDEYIDMVDFLTDNHSF